MLWLNDYNNIYNITTMLFIIKNYCKFEKRLWILLFIVSGCHSYTIVYRLLLHYTFVRYTASDCRYDYFVVYWCLKWSIKLYVVFCLDNTRRKRSDSQIMCYRHFLLTTWVNWTALVTWKVSVRYAESLCWLSYVNHRFKSFSNTLIGSVQEHCLFLALTFM